MWYCRNELAAVAAKVRVQGVLRWPRPVRLWESHQLGSVIIHHANGMATARLVKSLELAGGLLWARHWRPAFRLSGSPQRAHDAPVLKVIKAFWCGGKPAGLHIPMLGAAAHFFKGRPPWA